MRYARLRHGEQPASTPVETPEPVDWKATTGPSHFDNAQTALAVTQLVTMFIAPEVSAGIGIGAGIAAMVNSSGTPGERVMGGVNAALSALPVLGQISAGFNIAVVTVRTVETTETVAETATVLERVAAEGEGIALAEGQAAAPGMQGHHMFPQAEEFASQWEQAEVNIEEFRVQLSEGTHLGQLHGNAGIPGLGPGGLWNATWRSYFAGEAAAGRAITKAGLYEQMAQMTVDFQIPYYSAVP